jgi:hypothetical protein
MRLNRAALWLSLVAVCSLLIGGLVYITQRPEGSSYVSSWLHLPSPMLWPGLAYNLPSFAHALTFSLLTIILLPKAPWQGCAAWLTIETLFELGQHPAVSSRLAEAMPRYSMLKNFFQHGTFDPLDLLAILLGCLLALVLAIFTLRRHNEQL